MIDQFDYINYNDSYMFSNNEREDLEELENYFDDLRTEELEEDYIDDLHTKELEEKEII